MKEESSGPTHKQEKMDSERTNGGMLLKKTTMDQQGYHAGSTSEYFPLSMCLLIFEGIILGSKRGWCSQEHRMSLWFIVAVLLSLLKPVDGLTRSDLHIHIRGPSSLQ